MLEVDFWIIGGLRKNWNFWYFDLSTTKGLCGVYWVFGLFKGCLRVFGQLFKIGLGVFKGCLRVFKTYF